MYQPDLVEAVTYQKRLEVHQQPQQSYAQTPGNIHQTVDYSYHNQPVPAYPNTFGAIHRQQIRYHENSAGLDVPSAPSGNIQKNLAAALSDYVEGANAEGYGVPHGPEQHLQYTNYYPPQTDRPFTGNNASVPRPPPVPVTDHNKPSFFSKITGLFTSRNQSVSSNSAPPVAPGQIPIHGAQQSAGSCGCSRGMNLSLLGPPRLPGSGYNGIGYDMVGPGCCDGPGGYFSPLRSQGGIGGFLSKKSLPNNPVSRPSEFMRHEDPVPRQKVRRWCCC